MKEAPSPISWFVDDDEAPDAIFFPPEPMAGHLKGAQTASPLSACPALRDLHRGLYRIRSPLSLELEVELTQKGARLHLNTTRSSMSPTLVSKYCSLMRRRDWRSADRPVIQIFVPYVFVPQEDVIVRQTPPYLEYFVDRRPGCVIGGQFRARNWPRPLAFAFEWHNPRRPLKVLRGDSLFYVEFLHHQPRGFVLSAGSPDEAIRSQQARIGGVAAHVRQTNRLIDKVASPPIQENPDGS